MLKFIILLLLHKLVSSHHLSDATLNLIFVGSSLESPSLSGGGGSTNGVWPAVELAVEHVNQCGGLLAGHRLTVSTSKMGHVNSSQDLQTGVSVKIISAAYLLLRVNQCKFSKVLALYKISSFDLQMSLIFNNIIFIALS